LTPKLTRIIFVEVCLALLAVQAFIRPAVRHLGETPNPWQRFLVFLLPVCVLLLPGLCWLTRKTGAPGRGEERGEDLTTHVFKIVALSTAVLLGVIVLLAVGPFEPRPRTGLGASAQRLVIAYSVICNAGLILTTKRAATKWGFKLKWEHVTIVVLVTTFFCVGNDLIFKIPHQVDQDLEIQGTTFGLLADLNPAMVTDRKALHFFAHPLLFHFQVSGVILSSNQLLAFEPYYDAYHRAIRLLERLGQEEGWVRMVFIWDSNKRNFYRTMPVAHGRSVSLFFACLVVLTIFWVTTYWTGSAGAGLMAAALTASSPELFSRECMTSYAAVTNWILLCAVHLALLYRKRRATWLVVFSAALMAATINQKCVLMPASLVVFGVLALEFGPGFVGRTLAWLRRAFRDPSFLGFTAGIMAFALVGALVNWSEFVDEFILSHGADRLLPVSMQINTTEGLTAYPSIPELWSLFDTQAGGHLTLLSALAALAMIVGRRRDPLTAFAWLFVIGGVLFSLVDWKQTKHLMLVIPSMNICIATMWARFPGKVRWVVALVVAAALVYNTGVIVQVAKLGLDNVLTSKGVW